MRLSKFIVGTFLLIFFLLSQNLRAQEIPVLFEKPLSPKIANYNIDVVLHPDERMLDGQEVLIWHNKTPDTIHELQFHLYLNAFRNSESTFMRESGGVSRRNRISKDGWGFIEVEKILLDYGKEVAKKVENLPAAEALTRMTGSIDLTDQMEFIHPDDDNEQDKTVFRLPLPRPLPPGGTVVLKIDFEAKLPKPPFARTGAYKEYFFVGQWFPKIGVYIDGRWNCHQFHANSEFFADFGVYNVRITVPEENIVGATGIEVEVKENGDGTATHFYHAEDVHDFAWTTSPEFVEFKDKTQDVEIRLLLQPDHVGQARRHLAAAKTAIEHFQNWYGDYPFPNLTVVDPRRKAKGSGGMEYPTLITAGTSYGLPKGIRAVEMVIVHEFGHNYWYHLLASNEFEESWMDEGINTYTEIQIMNDAYGPVGDAVDFMGIKINDRHVHRASYIFSPDLDPMVRKAWEYYSGGSYGVNSYSKPGIVLTTLQNYLGKETMQKIMRTYVERWRFKHPKTQDFIDVVNEVAGQNLSWFFDQAFFSNAILDYSVDRIFTWKIKKPRGFDFTLQVEKKDTTSTNAEKASNTSLNSEEPDTAKTGIPDTSKSQKETKMYYSGVNIRRLGEFKFPVEIEVVFANGDTVREKWDGQGLWKKLRYKKPARLVSATVDPDSKILLDVNFTNNSKTIKKQRIGINKLSARFLFWMQFLLEQPEVLNLLTMLNRVF